MAPKIKNALTTWLCAMIVTLSFGETRAGDFFAASHPESGQIAAVNQGSTSDFYDASQYDASGYTVAPRTTPLRLPAPKGVASEGGAIRAFTQQTDQTYYRVFSGNKQGSWVTSQAPKSSAFAREALALPAENTASFIQKVLVPAGTQLQRSRALPAFGRRGGAEQFQLLNRIPTQNFGPRTPLK